MCRYSNQAEQVKRVTRTAILGGRTWPNRDKTPAATTGRVAFRLDEMHIGRLVAEYLEGATCRQLAERYEVARSTVIELLKRRRVVVRHPRMSPTDAGSAVEMYRQGMRQIDIAAHLGRSKSVIWHVLQRAGVI